MIPALISFLGGSVFRMLLGDFSTFLNKKQAQYYQDDRRPLFASYIAKYYDLPISESGALEELCND